MRFTSVLVTLALLAISAFAQNQCNGPSGEAGICIPTSDCANSGGSSAINYCPYDPPGVRCCTYGGCTISKDNNRGGACMPTAACTHGTLFPNRCPGNNDIQCCVTSGPYGRG